MQLLQLFGLVPPLCLDASSKQGTILYGHIDIPTEEKNQHDSNSRGRFLHNFFCLWFVLAKLALP